MISFALLTGIFSYSIFFLGIGKLLTPFFLSIVTILYILLLILVVFIKRKKLFIPIRSFDKNTIRILILLSLFFLVNLIGALGPEYSFDALWYHLTLPKLYLIHHSIYYIPGGLLYYSAMPKLAEMLFIPSLALSSEITAKLLQLFFGVLICIVLYRSSRMYYSKFISLLIVLIFYSNIVVSWESTVAYIDLIRTFYEFLAFVLFLRWQKGQKLIFLLLSSVMVGFAITTKLLSLGSLFILSVMMFVLSFQKRKSVMVALRCVFLYLLIALCIPLPWFIFSYVNTGNPVYPFFTPTYPTHASWLLLNPFTFLSDIFTLFTHASDPVSPIYLIVFPFMVFFPSFRREIKFVALYCLGALVMWYITPRTGGGRFILPYLPAFSLLIGEVITILRKQKAYRFYYLATLIVIFLISGSSLTYRAFAVKKYIPYVVDKQSKQSFLLEHLNFGFGDFIDVHHQIAERVSKNDVVLLIGFHNLFYVDFPFIDSSYVMRGDRFTYIATQNTSLPKEYADAQKVYAEKRTGVTLYKVGERRWKK